MVASMNSTRGSPTATTLTREPRADDVIIRRGDTLSEIAMRHGVTVSALLEANPSIRNPDRIFAGQALRIPRTAPPPPPPALLAEPAVDDEPSTRGPRRQPEIAVNVGAIQRRGAVAAELSRAPMMHGLTSSPSDVSAAELQQIVPGISDAKAAQVAQQLSFAMREANITTLRQRSAFIAQLAHESGGFHYMEEIASGAQYEGRLDLGNTQPGDGVRFKGRGYIQITGRHNYTQAGQALALDLVNQPHLAALPENAARIAAWYWGSRNINDPAERGDFVEVTRRINGGTNGLADRERYYNRALSALNGDGVPANPGTYVVAPGDTLGAIAQRFGTSVQTLLQLNPQITNPDHINVGQELRLPMSAPPRPAIDMKFDELGGAGGFLGAPAHPEERATPDGVGRYKHYERGSIYWTPSTGAHEVHGAIRDEWSRLGWERGLGYPVTDEMRTPDGAGRFSVFERGSIYWSPSTGAHEVRGAIRDKFKELGWEGGKLGYPTTGEEEAGAGRKSRFEKGTVYWTPTTGAHEVLGAIREKHDALAAESGMLGFPLTGEERAPDGVGRFSVFEHGSVYWSPSTGAHEIHGAIRDKYKELGWERSSLGYPTSDEYDVSEGKRSDFQHGSLTWNRATGAVTVTLNPGAPAAPPAAPTTRPYTVQSGDTLSGIASRHGTTVQVLLQMNPQITNPDMIQVGQVLQVPSSSSSGGPAPFPPGPGGPGRDLVPNQHALPPPTGGSACGPVALVALLRAKGIEMSSSAAVEVARQHGWSVAGGMNGFGNFISMARSQGLDFRTGGTGDVRPNVEAGRPVIISTARHYFVAQAFDPSTGKYFCGTSGTALRGGSQWLSLDQMAAMGNGINGVGWAQ